jgi:Epoxide hydrolase N terminus
MLAADSSQGVQQAVMAELARYWATEYDWRRCEEKLNALPHFITEIDGLDIHFSHVRSPRENALPVIITHGWPGSVIELPSIIGPLTNPAAYGASAADAFDVVIPSMPGYGYSGKPRDLGWGPVPIARLGRADEAPRLHAVRGARRRLGRGHHGPMGVQAPPGLLGIHTSMAGAVPADAWTALVQNVPGAGGPPPSGLSDEESRTYEQLNFFVARGSGTECKWGRGRRRCTAWRTRPSPWRPGCSTTTPPATPTSRLPSPGTPSAT